MLKMQAVKKIYRTDMIETHALRNFNLEVKEGEFVAVTGPSGSGKTTFLNIAGLLETFEEGQYLLDGKDVSRLNDNIRSKLRNEKIGFIFQGFNLISDLNIFDNVDVPLRYRGFSSSERKKRINNALEMVGLAARARHLPSQLSGGQQQRVFIARALAQQPQVLLLDEPTTGIDIVTQHSVLDLIKLLHHDLGLTIVLITHDINMIRMHVDRLVLLKTKLYAAGPPADVLKPDILRQVYGKDVVITDKDLVIVEDYHHHG